jgi:peptidoglycan hydrolase CwlO-like protein
MPTLSTKEAIAIVEARFSELEALTAMKGVLEAALAAEDTIKSSKAAVAKAKAEADEVKAKVEESKALMNKDLAEAREATKSIIAKNIMDIEAASAAALKNEEVKLNTLRAEVKDATETRDRLVAEATEAAKNLQATRSLAEVTQAKLTELETKLAALRASIG